MTPVVACCSIIVSIGLVVAFAVSAPEALSDKNAFLANFVNHEILNVLGVILAITLASAGQLHLALNKLEEQYKRPGGMRGTRGQVHRAAYWLIGFFVAAVVLVVAKPRIALEPWLQTLFNGAGLIILLCNVLVLISITQIIFKVPAHKDDS